MKQELAQKFQQLQDILRNMGRVAIAFSGGVDSTLLVKVARDTLGPSGVLAVTAVSSTYPERELKEARQLAQTLEVEHRLIVSEELDIPGFSENPPDRCYYCKSELFTKLWQEVKRAGIEHVLDGANVDDTGDYRPGMRAAREKGVRSPLQEAGLTKEDIRVLSRELGLPTWDKPAFACLSSRFPYGQRITPEKLRQVEAAEEYLRNLGVAQCRVRHHDQIARIEVEPVDFSKVVGAGQTLVDYFRNLGFDYITLDLGGYRQGSMNASLVH